MKAHEHALDQGMALGFRDLTAARHMAKKWKKDADQKLAGEHGEDDSVHHEKSYVDVGGQTNIEAVMNLLNNCLGSGVLCVPVMVKNCGIGAAVVMLTTSAVINRFGLSLILNCMHITNVEASYNGVGRVTFGDKGRLAVVAIFIGMGF